MVAVAKTSGMPTNKTPAVGYLDDETNKAFDALCKEERRSRSQMVAIAIEELLRSKGHLPKDDPPSAKR